jgi:hypothetical protein
MGYTAWEYRTLPECDRDRLVDLGSDGWELVGIGGEADARLLYLKRLALDFRERVTLDQRRQVYESLGLDARRDPSSDTP